MPTFSSEAHSLIALMDRQYREIRALEAEHTILGREGDFRPRIEYYHDAVRALTSESDNHLSKDSRLSVERLAYDIAMLRHICAKPLSAGRGKGHYSPNAELTAAPESGGAGGMDREEKRRLTQLYKDYTVLFAAIFAEKADRNAIARSEEAESAIEDCHTLQDLLEELARGEISAEEMMAMAQHVEHDGLRQAVNHLMQQRGTSRSMLQQAAARLKDTAKGLDQEIKELDKAALSYAGNQLLAYEESKDTVKRMASEGLNLAGKFVETAMARAGNQRRGR